MLLSGSTQIPYHMLTRCKKKMVTNIDRAIKQSAITAIYNFYYVTPSRESATRINVKHFRYDVNDKDDALTNNEKSRKELRTPFMDTIGIDQDRRICPICFKRKHVRPGSTSNTS